MKTFKPWQINVGDVVEIFGDLTDNWGRKPAKAVATVSKIEAIDSIYRETNDFTIYFKEPPTELWVKRDLPDFSTSCDYDVGFHCHISHVSGIIERGKGGPALVKDKLYSRAIYCEGGVSCMQFDRRDDVHLQKIISLVSREANGFRISINDDKLNRVLTAKGFKNPVTGAIKIKKAVKYLRNKTHLVMNNQAQQRKLINNLLKEEYEREYSNSWC